MKTLVVYEQKEFYVQGAADGREAMEAAWRALSPAMRSTARRVGAELAQPGGVSYVVTLLVDGRGIERVPRDTPQIAEPA